MRCYCDWADRDWTLFAYHLLNQHSFLIQVPDGTPNPVNVVREVISQAMKAGEIPRRNADLAAAAAIGVVMQPAAYKVYGRFTGPFGPCPLLRRRRLGGAVGQGKVNFVRCRHRGFRRGLRAAVPDGPLYRAPAPAGLVTAPSRLCGHHRCRLGRGSHSDLGPSIDPHAFLKARLARSGFPNALAFMTSRDIRRHHLCRRRAGAVEAACLTTVGLSNGERVGTRKAHGPHAGTINTLVHVSVPLTDGALVEAISIVAQARTAAVIESQHVERGTAITGTGTDCIVVASPCRGEPVAWAELHTEVGEAIGGAVYDATRAGAEQWDQDAVGQRHGNMHQRVDRAGMWPMRLASPNALAIREADCGQAGRFDGSGPPRQNDDGGCRETS